MIITFLVIFSFLRELRKKRNYSFRSSGRRLETRENTLTTSDSTEDLFNFASTSISETIYSSATSATFKLRHESSSICSDITNIPEDNSSVSRRCSEQDTASSGPMTSNKRLIGQQQKNNRQRYGSRGSLPRRRRTTGRLDSCPLLNNPYLDEMMYIFKPIFTIFLAHIVYSE